jgi:hypothetical protein
MITAGEIVVDMRATNLDTNSTTWLNMSTSLDPGGDFTTNNALFLNVATIGGYQALNVGGSGANAVKAALTSPASLLGSSVGSVEAWVACRAPL